MLENNKINFALINSIISVFLYYILFNSNFLYEFFVGGSKFIFGDYRAAIEMVVCSQENNNYNCPEFAYGKILTFLPYSEKFEIIYQKIIPILLILTFIICVVFSFNFDNKMSVIILYLSLFNPSTLLLIERLNLDILIFISIFIISINRIYFINWMILINLNFLKIYPLILTLVVFFENKKRDIVSSIIIFILIFLIIIFLVFKFNLLETLNAYGTESKAGYFYLFSFNHLPKLLKYSFEFNYILSLTVFGLILLYTFVTLCRKNKIIFENIDHNNSELILFNLGSIILIISFLIYSNYYYREIFLVCIFPLLLRNSFLKINYIRYFIYFIILRYIFEYIYSYVSLTDFIFYIENVRKFKFSFIFTSYIKSFLDLILIVNLSYLVYVINKSFVVKKISTLNRFFKN